VLRNRWERRRMEDTATADVVIVVMLMMRAVESINEETEFEVPGEEEKSCLKRSLTWHSFGTLYG
jgi:hypothetical protein